MSYWDQLAATYTNLWELDTPEGRVELDRLRHIFRRHAIASVNMQVLDIACGKAAILPLLLERIGPGGQVIGLDVSRGMLAGAHESSRSIGMAPPHWLICADGHHLPVAAASLDLVIVFNALPHFDDRFRLFSEVARVLRPDGHFTIMHSQNRRELDEMHASLGFAMEQSSLPTAAQFSELLDQVGLVCTELIDNSSTDYFLLTASRG